MIPQEPEGRVMKAKSSKRSRNSRPSPMELAKLAAIIAPNAARGPAMTAAMARAMEFYEEAKQFVGELPNDPANPEWRGYRTEAVTDAMRADLKAMRSRLSQLKKDALSSA